VRTVSEGMEIAPVEALPDPLWRRIVAEPERAPELIALAAATRFADPAAEWVQEASRWHKPDQLATKVYRRHVHLSRAEGMALGLGGAMTSPANVAGLGWIQARMVFFIAAAYGYDPHDLMRPAELLALWGVYDTPAEARASLDGVGDSMAASVVRTQLSRSGGRSLTNRMLRYVGKRTAKRYGGRMIPFVGAPISALQNGGSTKDLGRRALAYYGGSGADTGARPG
jgi:EcsC protein family